VELDFRLQKLILLKQPHSKTQGYWTLPPEQTLKIPLKSVSDAFKTASSDLPKAAAAENTHFLKSGYKFPIFSQFCSFFWVDIVNRCISDLQSSYFKDFSKQD